MVSANITVKNKAGIHARPSQMIVQTAEEFYCDIFLNKKDDNFKANAKSIFNVMSLAAECGSDLEIIADGEDEEEALEAMIEIFEKKFKEE